MNKKIRIAGLIAELAATAIIHTTPSQSPTLPQPSQSQDESIQVLATGLKKPWAIAFSDDQIFVTEKGGNIRVIQSGVLLDEPWGAFIEFIHTATLLHDDVVYRAELRRGMDSANSKWGNEASVLVGDFLFTKCFSLLVQSGNWKILQTISKATTTMAEGELEELIKTNDHSLTEDGYLSIITRKTASLISAATQIGAILGNVSEEKERALSEFGVNVGIAFQLIDDQLDYTSNEEEFGKKIGIDLQDGKITLPLISTLHHSNPEEKAFIQKTVESKPITRDAFFRWWRSSNDTMGSCIPGKRREDTLKRRRIIFSPFQIRRRKRPSMPWPIMYWKEGCKHFSCGPCEVQSCDGKMHFQ